jgi:hypothetical protein
MWHNLRYPIITEFSWPESENIRKISQLIHTVTFKPAYFRSRSKMANRYIPTLVDILCNGFEAQEVVIEHLRQPTSQQYDRIYEIRFSYHDIEGLPTLHHICGYLKTISRLYRSYITSKI